MIKVTDAVKIGIFLTFVNKALVDLDGNSQDAGQTGTRELFGSEKCLEILFGDQVNTACGDRL